MTMNSSGPISLAGSTAGVSIEVELGGAGTTQISLNCTTVRTLAGVASGAITMPTNFYGKSNFTGNYYLNSISFNSNNQNANIKSMLVDSSANLYVLFNDINTNDTSIVKYDATGAIVWAYRYSIYYYNTQHGVVFSFDSSGNLNIFALFGGTTLNFMKVNSSTGAAISQTNIAITTSTGSTPYAYSATTDSSGNIYIVGSYFSSYQRPHIAKINSSGTTVWKTALSYSSGGYLQEQIGVDPLGNVWITASYFNGSGPSAVLVKFDSSGNLLWQYGGLPKIQAPNVAAIYDPMNITFDSSNNAYVVIGGQAFIVSQSGTLLYQFSANNMGNGIAFLQSDSSGNLYFIGAKNSNNDFTNGLIVLKTDYTGSTQSLQRILGLADNTGQQGMGAVIASNGDMYLGYSDIWSSMYVGRLPANGNYTGVYKSASTNYEPLYYYQSSSYATLSNPGVSFSSGPFSVISSPITYTTSSVTLTGSSISAVTSKTNNLSGFTSGYGSALYMGQICGSSSYTWIAPTGVTSVSAVVIGSGGAATLNSTGGYGSGLAYVNNYSVTPGNSYTVSVPMRTAYFASTSVAYVNGRLKSAGTGGGNGGTNICHNSGGGAAGYSGNGGNAGINGAAQAGSGGGGGGGRNNGCAGSGGGGVNVFGQGSNGAGGTSPTCYGGGGSCGTRGAKGCNVPCCFSCPCNPQYGYAYGGNGGAFGGGPGTGLTVPTKSVGNTYAAGVVRIVWPGTSRTFPSTCVASP